MTYEAKFRERGHAWYTYRGLNQRYRRIDESVLSKIKINGSTVTILDDGMLSDLERIAAKAGAKYKLKEVDE